MLKPVQVFFDAVLLPGSVLDPSTIIVDSIAQEEYLVQAHLYHKEALVSAGFVFLRQVGGNGVFILYSPHIYDAFETTFGAHGFDWLPKVAGQEDFCSDPAIVRARILDTVSRTVGGLNPEEHPWHEDFLGIAVACSCKEVLREVLQKLRAQGVICDAQGEEGDLSWILPVGV